MSARLSGRAWGWTVTFGVLLATSVARLDVAQAGVLCPGRVAGEVRQHDPADYDRTSLPAESERRIQPTDAAEPAKDTASFPLGTARLRTADERLRLAIRDGYDRSATFRALVDRLAAHKGMVLVHWAPALTSGLNACLLHQIVVTPDGGRVLWVLVKHNEPSDHLVTVLAHELQHVLEVLDAGVSDTADIEGLFKRVGVRTGSHGLTRRLPVYETDAAQTVQDRVKRELRTTLPAGRGNAR